MTDIQGFLDRFYQTPQGQACMRLRDEERRRIQIPGTPLTPEEAQRRADVIRESWADSELAAHHQHKLWQDVLVMISLGLPMAKELATAALSSREER